MRRAVCLLLVLACQQVTYADSLIATAPGTFQELVFDEAVMRTFSGVNPDQLVVSQSGAIGSAVTSGTLHPGSVIQVDFDTPVRDLTVVFEPALTTSVTCEVEGIEQNGNLLSLGALFSSAATSNVLSGTFGGRVFRTLRIRPNSGVMRLLRVDYRSNRIQPGQTISIALLGIGESRDAFISGCEGRSLELTPNANLLLSDLRISVGPANDLLDEHTRTFTPKADKTRSIPIDRPEIYRVRIQNAGLLPIGSFSMATSESFSAKYDKQKFTVDPISNLTTADLPFGTIPDTEIDISIKPIGEFSSPPTFKLLENPSTLEELDLATALAGSADGIQFKDATVRRGGLVRLRCSNIGNTTNFLKVTIKRSRPLPGVGNLEL